MVGMIVCKPYDAVIYSGDARSTTLLVLDAGPPDAGALAPAPAVEAERPQLHHGIPVTGSRQVADDTYRITSIITGVHFLGPSWRMRPFSVLTTTRPPVTMRARQPKGLWLQGHLRCPRNDPISIKTVSVPQKDCITSSRFPINLFCEENKQKQSSFRNTGL
ncbi:hypothetical protein EVAR_17937_1 [Eumeta japonica]|uniref:Uncharacterized protein n=1 Tax=Eumeta variegata TaxID=151549 RepID=A0A4C1UYB4_EUMVA|nr:hypothetical protein EVAR_17937_1 [Eumeta japonica]